jgi:hypothetical protein
MTTYAIVVRKSGRERYRGVQLEQASAETLPEIVEFMQMHGPRRQFFPALALEDFTGGRRLRGLAPEDVLIARRAGLIAGVMAVWDQAAYKQDIVGAYGQTLVRAPSTTSAPDCLAFALPPARAGRFRWPSPPACIANDDLR